MFFYLFYKLIKRTLLLRVLQFSFVHWEFFKRKCLLGLFEIHFTQITLCISFVVEVSSSYSEHSQNLHSWNWDSFSCINNGEILKNENKQNHLDTFFFHLTLVNSLKRLLIQLLFYYPQPYPSSKNCGNVA